MIEKILAKDETGLLADFNAVTAQAAGNPAVITAAAKAANKKRNLESDETQEEGVIPIAQRQHELTFIEVIEEQVPAVKRYRNKFFELHQTQFASQRHAAVLLNAWIEEKVTGQIGMGQVTDLMSQCAVTVTLDYDEKTLLGKRRENFAFKQALNAQFNQPGNAYIPTPSASAVSSFN